MFCPQCAAENQDHTKFCRNCGMDLRAVGLALNALLMPRPKGSDVEGKNSKWLKRESDGIHSVVQGVLLSVMSVLLGVALALFSNKPDWIIIWLIFCGWLAVWGTIEMGSGISDLIQSRIMLRRIDRLASRAIIPSTPAVPAMPAVEDTQRMAETADAREASSPLSVTEHTTAPLNKPGSHL
jgi:zinc-ribbon domain